MARVRSLPFGDWTFGHWSTALTAVLLIVLSWLTKSG